MANQGMHRDLWLLRFPFHKQVTISKYLFQALPQEQRSGRTQEQAVSFLGVGRGSRHKNCVFDCGRCGRSCLVQRACLGFWAWPEAGYTGFGGSCSALGLSLDSHLCPLWTNWVSVFCTYSPRELTGNRRLTGRRWRKEPPRRRRSTSHPMNPPFSQR